MKHPSFGAFATPRCPYMEAFRKFGRCRTICTRMEPRRHEKRHVHLPEAAHGNKILQSAAIGRWIATVGLLLSQARRPNLSSTALTFQLRQYFGSSKWSPRLMASTSSAQRLCICYDRSRTMLFSACFASSYNVWPRLPTDTTQFCTFATRSNVI